MHPTNLKAIAREAGLRGDTKTLFQALDLLEPLMPIATFMDFCTELEELRLQGAAHGRTETFGTSQLRERSTNYHGHVRVWHGVADFAEVRSSVANGG